MPRRAICTVVLVTATSLAGLFGAPPAGAAAGCSAYYVGTGSWSTQAGWFADSAGTTALGHVPGTAGHTADVACWSGTSAPTVDGASYEVAGIQATGSAFNAITVTAGSLTTDGPAATSTSALVQGGSLTVAPGQALTLGDGGSLTATGGTVTLGQGSSIGHQGSSGFLDIDGAVLTVAGDATITASTQLNGGRISLGSPSRPTELDITGTYSQAITGELDAFFDGTGSESDGTYSELDATGDVSLDLGTLVGALGPDARITAGDTYAVVTSATAVRGGLLDAKSTLGAGLTAYPLYHLRDLSLVLESTYRPARGLSVSGVPDGTEDSTVSLRRGDGTLATGAPGHSPEVSPDGALLARPRGVTADGTGASLELDNGATGTTTNLTLAPGGGALTGVTLSPDDGFVAFSQACSVYLEPSSGFSEQLTLLAGSTTRCFSAPQFSGDGTHLTATDAQDGISSVPLDFATNRAATGFAATRAGDFGGALSPDGTRLAFLRPTGTAGQANVLVAPPTLASVGGGEGGPGQPTVAASAQLTSTPITLGGQSPVRWNQDSAVYVNGTTGGDATSGGRDGIYRLDATADGPQPGALVTGTLVNAGAAGVDQPFAIGRNAATSTTLPLRLTPGAAATPWQLLTDGGATGLSDIEPVFTVSGLPGLRSDQISIQDTLTQGYVEFAPGPAPDTFTGRLSFHTGQVDAGTSDVAGYAIALAAGAPAGVLHVTVQLTDEGYALGGVTADAPIIVGSRLGPPAIAATAGDTTATASFGAAPTSDGATVTNYHLTLAPADGTAPLTADVPPTTATSYSHQFAGLTNGLPYTATVTATDSDGDTANSQAVTVVPSGKPFAPSSLTATVSGQGQVTVAVGAANPNGSPVTDYHLTLGGPGSPSRDVTSPGTVTFSGLPDSATYTASAFAVNANGNGPPVSAAAVTTPATPAPNAPGSVAASPGDRQATVSFTPPTTGQPITGYLLTLTPVTGGASVSVVTPGSPVVVPGLTNGTTYAVTVLAIGPSGRSPVSGQGVFVTPHARPTPPRITGIAPAPETLLVGFTQANGDGLPILTDTVTCVGTNHQTAVARGTASPIRLTHLHNQVNYTCTVVATTAAGTSLVSNKVVAHPGKLPNVKLALPATAAKGSRITIAATLTSAGDLVPNRLALLYVSADVKHRHFVAIARGYTNRHGVVTFHTVIRKGSVYQVQAYFGPALAFNHGDRVRVA